MGFILCGKCGLPFTAKGLGAHARSCSGTRPPRSLEPLSSCPGGDGGTVQGRGEREEPSALGSPSIRHHHVGGSRPGGENVSPGFLPPLIAASKRSSMMSTTMIPGSSTRRSAAAQALQALMLNSACGEKKWLMDEISLYYVPVKRRNFPKEASRLLREALDETLSMALSLFTVPRP